MSANAGDGRGADGGADGGQAKRRHGEPEPFYVGYLPQAPRSTGRFVARVAALLLVGAAVLGGALALVPSRLPDKVFEWTTATTLIGVIDAEPVPTLRVRRPGGAEHAPWSSYLLVAPGKFGAAEQVQAFDGEWVELEGMLIYREDRTMVEVVDGTIRRLADAMDVAAADAPHMDAIELGEHTLIGEIIDSKCYLGVMAPGHTKPHRACAVRCISGGIPPALLVRQEDGRALTVLLVGPEGRAVNSEVLDLVAEPVEITGHIRREGDLLFLEADPDTYRRLN